MRRWAQSARRRFAGSTSSWRTRAPSWPARRRPGRTRRPRASRRSATRPPGRRGRRARRGGAQGGGRMRLGGGHAARAARAAGGRGGHARRGAARGGRCQGLGGRRAERAAGPAPAAGRGARRPRRRGGGRGQHQGVPGLYAGAGVRRGDLLISAVAVRAARRRTLPRHGSSESVSACAATARQQRRARHLSAIPMRPTIEVASSCIAVCASRPSQHMSCVLQLPGSGLAPAGLSRGDPLGPSVRARASTATARATAPRPA